MLLTFLYHRVGRTGDDKKYSNSKKMIEEHLSLIAKKFNIVTPGEKLPLWPLNICLTFDDAYFDFYHFVFPILKKLNIKALLAVPVKYIQKTTDLPPEKRLSVPLHKASQEKIAKTKAPFCTWKELEEMANSNLVQIASHSYSHANLLSPGTDLELEIIESKQILKKKLKMDIQTFIYPQGKFNMKIHHMVRKHYSYVMRIGSALNFGWQNTNKINYRIVCDRLEYPDASWKSKKILSYLWFYLLNALRGR